MTAVYVCAVVSLAVVRSVADPTFRAGGADGGERWTRGTSGRVGWF